MDNNCDHQTEPSVMDVPAQIAYGLCPKCNKLVGFTLEEKIDWLIRRMLEEGRIYGGKK